MQVILLSTTWITGFFSTAARTDSPNPPPSLPHQQAAASGVCWWNHLAFNLGLQEHQQPFPFSLPFYSYMRGHTFPTSQHKQQILHDSYGHVWFIWTSDRLYCWAVIWCSWALISSLWVHLFSFDGGGLFSNSVLFVYVQIWNVFGYFHSQKRFLGKGND